MKYSAASTTLFNPIVLILSILLTSSSVLAYNSEDDLKGGLLIHNLEHSWDSESPSYIPTILRSFNVKAKVLDGIAQVDMIQEFQTPEFFPTSFEKTSAVYQLPLDELAAVTGFKAEIDDRVVTAIVKEKQEARQEYEEAVQSGKSAYLAEQTRADIFHISVGNLPNGKIVRVTLSYTTTLEAIDSTTLRFVFPTDIAPRYEPYENSEGSIPDGIDLMNSGVNIEMDVTMGEQIDSIESPTHEISVANNGDDSKKAKVQVLEEDPQERDLVVYLNTQSTNDGEPLIFIEPSVEYNSTAVMLSFVPQIPESLFSGATANSEFIFIIDRSGSMGGTKMEQTKEAMSHVLDQIPEGSLLNIVGFGSDYKALFSNSKSIDDNSVVKAARSYIEEMEADFGGTEILKPIQYVLKKSELETHQRVVFVFTDGQVGNTDDVIEYVGRQTNISGGRVFSLGIGEHVSALLVRGIARTGRGTAEFVDGDNSKAIEDAVTRQMKVATTPALTNVEMNWGLSYVGQQAPYYPPPLVDGKRFLMYYLVPGTDYVPSSIDFESRILGSETDIQYSVSNEAFIDVELDNITLIHKIAARSLIRDLEEGASDFHFKEKSEDEIKGEIVRLGVKYQIASSETSFIAVDNKGTNNNLGVSDGYFDEADIYMSMPGSGGNSRAVPLAYSLGFSCHAYSWNVFLALPLLFFFWN